MARHSSLFISPREHARSTARKKYGFSSTGCTIRIGTTYKEMTPEQIRSRYEMNFTDTDYMTLTRSKYGAISFKTLKIYYMEKGYHLEDRSFEANLGLKTPLGEYNLLAELLSDKNTIPLIVVKFKGMDKSSVSERNDYGCQSLLFAYEQIKNRLLAENICVTDTTLVLENPAITMSVISNKLGISYRTVQRVMKDLLQKNLVIRTGARKNGRWIVILDASGVLVSLGPVRK